MLCIKKRALKSFFVLLELSKQLDFTPTNFAVYYFLLKEASKL